MPDNQYLESSSIQSVVAFVLLMLPAMASGFILLAIVTWNRCKSGQKVAQ